MALPVVTPRDLHLARLNPAVLRLLKHRAAAAAHRQFEPVLAADRAAFSTANRSYRVQAQSARGATSMVENALTQALRGLKGSGLQGGYLKQVQNEFTSGQRDAANAIPFLLADASQQRASDFADARAQLLKDRAAMQSSGAAAFNQLLKETRKSASGAVKARGTTSTPRALKIALVTAHSIYSELLHNAGGKDKHGNVIKPPVTDPEWRAFALSVAKTEGADPVDALNAVAVLRQQLRRRLQGVLNGHGSVPVGGVFNAR